MTKNLQILSSNYFLIGLSLLLLNDFLLKDLFANWFTGKLSDFAGLFIFPLFWTAIFPRYKNKIFILTGLAFIYWKSSYSQAAIDLWNLETFLPISRIVDYTDLIALIILPLSFHFETKKETINTTKIYPLIPLLVSLIAFTATSYHKSLFYNKSYNFNFPKSDLVRKINTVAKRNKSENLPLSLHIENANDFTVNNGDTSWYFSSGKNMYNDTVWMYKKVFSPNDNSLYETIKTDEIDTIYNIESTIKDSMYIDKNGEFYFDIPVAKYMKDSRTGYCSSVRTKLRIVGDEKLSSLIIVTIYTQNCMGMFEKSASRKEEENLLKEIEDELIKKIKNAPKN